MISGKKNNRLQTLHRISFGGKSINIEESYKTGIDFVNRLKKNIEKKDIKYILSSLEKKCQQQVAENSVST